MSTASRATTLSEQLRSLTFLAKGSELQLAKAYAVGVLFGGENGIQEPLDGLGDEDYSVLIESYMRAGLVEDERLVVELRRLSCQLIRSVTPSAFSTKLPLNRIAVRFGRLAYTKPASSIQSLRRYLAQVKRASVHLIGPDVVTVLQVMIDPTRKIKEEEAARAFEILSDWGLTSTGHYLLLLRLLGPFESERSYIFKNVANIEASLGLSGEGRLQRILDGEPGFPEDDEAPGLDDGLLLEIERLAFALDAQSAADTHSAVLKLFLRDPVIIEFLPWREILRVVEMVSLSTPESLFTTMLMRAKVVQRSFPAVALRVGDGGFIGNLTKFVLAEKKPDILGIFARIKELPSAAAEALASAILEPQILEKLVGAFASRPALGELATAGDNVHLVRIDAIREARRRTLVSPSVAAKEIAEESEKAKLHHLEMNLRLGRVRFPREAIKKATAATMEGLPLELIDNSASGEPDSEVVKRAASYIAEGVSIQILLESPTSINQGLSNNLRHGIVVPRMLRAFDDSLQMAHLSRDQLPQWQEVKLRPFFGEDAARIIEFREAVNETLKAWQEEYLVVVLGGALDVSMRVKIAAVSEQSLLDHSDSKSSLEDIILDLTEREVRNFLSAASKVLTDGVLPSLLDRLNALRAETKAGGVAFTKTYLDNLETSLSRAAEDVAKWIAITERDEVLPFKLDQLVNLELRTGVLNDWRRLKVETHCIDDRLPRAANNMLIDGPYFDLFQSIVHNLISNSYKYSGLENRTQIRLILLYRRGELIIQCVNDISKERLSEVIRDFDNIVQRAKSTLKKGSDRDKLSGFLKIRGAFLLSMNRNPTINVHPVSVERPRFVVDIRIRNPPEIFYVPSQDSYRRG